MPVASPLVGGGVVRLPCEESEACSPSTALRSSSAPPLHSGCPSSELHP